MKNILLCIAICICTSCATTKNQITNFYLTVQQNEDNPFSDSTKISFVIPIGDTVSLEVKTTKTDSLVYYTERFFSAGQHYFTVYADSLSKDYATDSYTVSCRGESNTKKLICVQ